MRIMKIEQEERQYWENFEKDYESTLEEMEKSLCDTREDELFGRKSVQELWRDFENGQVSWSRVWAIFVIKHWLEWQQINL